MTHVQYNDTVIIGQSLTFTGMYDSQQSHNILYN